MRKFLFLVILLVILIAGFYQLDKKREDSGKPTDEIPEEVKNFTPATETKINPKDVELLAALDREYSALVDAVVPSVVSLTTSRRARGQQDPFADFFGRRGFRGMPRHSLGSGVIVSKEGHIVTNHHVIADMDEVKVQLNNGKIEDAQVIGSDEEMDIAVLKVNAKDLVPLPLGDSDQVKVGQMVFAIGNPFGLQETVTQGIISAKGRRQVEDSENEFFQTDTAINPGNSGGPLVNLRGEIIGINSAIFSGSGTWSGVGFAIPSNAVRESMERIIKGGSAADPQQPRGYLGVVIQELTPELAQQLNAGKVRGAVVAEVSPDSPAEEAGLQRGDIITRFNGRPVNTRQQLIRRVGEAGVGNPVEVGIFREGEEIEIKTELRELPEELAMGGQPQQRQPQQRRQPQTQPPTATSALAGVTVEELPRGGQAKLPENVKGVVVTNVAPGSAAFQTLEPGDIIEQVNREDVASVEDFNRVLEALPPREPLMMLIARDRARTFVVLRR